MLKYAPHFPPMQNILDKITLTSLEKNLNDVPIISYVKIHTFIP